MLFLVIGFLCLVFMLFTSKYYLFGAAAILSFLLYFLYFGSGNWLTLLLFLFGIMLLVVELFIPDFGLVGVAGFLMVVAGLFLNNERILESVLDVSLAIIISGVATSVLLKKGYKFLPDRSKLILGHVSEPGARVFVQQRLFRILGNDRNSHDDAAASRKSCNRRCGARRSQ